MKTSVRIACLLALTFVLGGCGDDESSSKDDLIVPDAGGEDTDGVPDTDHNEDGGEDEPDVAEPEWPLALEPGETAEIALDEGVGGAVLSGEGSPSYLLVLGSTRLDGRDDAYDYSVGSDGDSFDAAGAATIEGCSLSDETWRDAEIEAEEVPTGAGPDVGEERTFLIDDEPIDTRAIAVGESAVVWADITPEHPAELDDAFVQEFLDDFEALILPRARYIFGMESDVDEDGRISLLFSPLTYDTAVAYFFGCDLRYVVGCPEGNATELLYLTPPNAIDPPYNTANAIKEILAHELQHLIHFNRGLILNDLNRWSTNAYLLEGFGALAQDVVGFQAGNLYVTVAGLNDIDTFSLGDILVENGAYDRTRDGALRGGAYLFVRWLYDRAGGDIALEDGAIESTGGPAFARAMAGTEDPSLPFLTGISNGAEGAAIAMDFFTALGASNRDDDGGVAPTNPCFSYLPTQSDPLTGRQRGANVFASFHGQQMHGPEVQAADSADGSLRSGGVEFLRIAGAGSDIPVSVTVDPDAEARLRAVRIE